MENRFADSKVGAREHLEFGSQVLHSLQIYKMFCHYNLKKKL